MSRKRVQQFASFRLPADVLEDAAQQTQRQAASSDWEERLVLHRQAEAWLNMRNDTPEKDGIPLPAPPKHGLEVTCGDAIGSLLPGGSKGDECVHVTRWPGPAISGRGGGSAGLQSASDGGERSMGAIVTAVEFERVGGRSSSRSWRRARGPCCATATAAIIAVISLPQGFATSSALEAETMGWDAPPSTIIATSPPPTAASSVCHSVAYRWRCADASVRRARDLKPSSWVSEGLASAPRRTETASAR